MDPSVAPQVDGFTDEVVIVIVAPKKFEDAVHND